MIRLPSGGCVSGVYLTTIFHEYPGAVRQFQVRQASDFSLQVLYVPNREYSDLSQVLKKVKGTLEEKTRGEVAVSMEEVNHIPHDRGKLHYVRSDVGV